MHALAHSLTPGLPLCRKIIICWLYLMAALLDWMDTHGLPGIPKA